jgi:hypothetical protein
MSTGSSGRGIVVGIPAITAWAGAALGVEEEGPAAEGGDPWVWGPFRTRFAAEDLFDL